MLALALVVRCSGCQPPKNLEYRRFRASPRTAPQAGFFSRMALLHQSGSPFISSMISKIRLRNGRVCLQARCPSKDIYDLDCYKEEPGSGLYLPAVTTCVYTMPRFVSRQARVTKIMEAFGFHDWRFHVGTTTQRSYLVDTRLDWARLLRENEPPFLMLEDDIEPLHFRAFADLPADADIAYLGAGTLGWGRAAKAAALEWGISPVHRMHGYCYQDYDKDWFRLFGMLYSHAILFLDKTVMLEASDLFIQYGETVDGVDGCLQKHQHRWQVYCVKKPMFWQNDGHHLYDTRDYFDESWARETVMGGCKQRPMKFDRASRLRRQRQGVLHQL